MFSGTAQKALDMARDVDAKLGKHEEICAQRQGRIISDLAEVRDGIKRMFWLLVIGGATLIYNALHAKGML